MTALAILPSGHLRVAEPEALSLSKGEESLPSTLNAAFKDSLGKNDRWGHPLNNACS
jgi:hypothetical protein